MRRLAPLLFLTLVAGASARELPRTIVLVDGERVAVGVPILEDSTYRVDLAKILPLLTGGHATLQATMTECRVVVDGEVRLRMETGPNAPAAATRPDGGRIRLPEAPLTQALKAGGRRLYLDIRAVESLTGATAELEGGMLAFTTPEWWGHLLGIHANRLTGLNARSVGTSPEIGITPPARTMLAWVRPMGRSFVQIYKGLADGVGSPMFATTPLGRSVVDDDSGANLPTMLVCSPDEPAHAPTHHLGAADGREAMYAAVVAASDLGEEPIAAINRGTEVRWSIVGVGGRVVDAPITFGLDALRPGERASAFAARTRMPLDLLLAMNGFGERSVPKPGTQLVFIREVQPLKTASDAPQTAGLYEVRAGDTVATLAARWNVPAETICNRNEIDEGEELDPGRVLVRVAPRDHPPTEACRVKAAEGLARTKGRVSLFRAPEGSATVTTLPPGIPVTIRGQSGGRTLVRFGGEGDCLEGYVLASALVVQAEPPVILLTRIGPREQRIRQEALAHLGTPYRWGCNDIAHGIDCSHFVATVLARSGAYAPTPPVASQEQQGRIVHWKAGEALRGLSAIRFPSAEYPGQPSLDRLQIGDRLIIQHPPINQRAGGRHTGVFIGPYDGPYGHFKYAVVHAGSHGIAVVDIRHLWSDYRYAVHDGPDRRVAVRSRGAG